MDLISFLHALVPSSTSVTILLGFFAYLAIAGSILPGKVVPGVTLSDRTRLHYRCNGLLTLILLVALLGIGVRMSFISPAAIADKGLELLSATFVLSFVVALLLYVAGRRSHNQGSSLKPHVTGNLIDDCPTYWSSITRNLWCMSEVCHLSLVNLNGIIEFACILLLGSFSLRCFSLLDIFVLLSSERWLGVQLNPQFMGIDLKFFFVRAGMMGWLVINLSILAKNVKESNLSQSMVLYQIFCALYILDYFVHEEYMTSTWDIIAEKLGFMLVFGDLVWIPFTFSIQGWWLLSNKVELTTAAVIANCLVFLIGYLVFRGANKQKHVFKKNPKATIWGRPPKLIGGKLLASGYWGIARHCNYLGDLLVAASFSLPCGIISPIPYFYPIYLLILLIWRERRDEARCAEKYREVWVEYCKLVPWRILPYVY